MNIDFLLIFFVARYLRTSLKTAKEHPEWERKLRLAMYVSMGLFIATVSVDKGEVALSWLGHACLLGCIYVLYKNPLFKSAKSIVIAIGPYAITALITESIKLIAPGLHKDYRAIIEGIDVFAVLWGIGVWIMTSRQKKELDKTKAKVAAQAEDNRMIAAMKTELEIQVAERTAELTKQKEELEVALTELKATQAQLIQSEKMASLGELTAGIAHEIQNPLNFVNNFSEVSNELVEELKHEKGKQKEQRDEQLEEELLNDIAANLQKINHHGRRADAIVKGMLQHSRKNTGQTEPTDINALVDEYLRLSYHGLRAKDKEFNAGFTTSFDESIGMVNMVSQDVGRVLLNLFNNAFYAVNEKKQTAGAEYKPTLDIATHKVDNKAEIIIADNGSGIPESVVEKVFQPFFTTKPTGQGTGLGLSLAYDIIKAHNGEIKVETKEGEGTKFIITLPV